MLKRTIAHEHIVEYIHAMFKDIKWAYKRHTQWERDKSRVLHELVNRGLRTLTIDFPSLCKHFDKCLDEGLYTASNLAFGRVSKSAQVPVFLRDLFLQVFDEKGCLRDDPSLHAIFDIRQVFLGLAKVRLACGKGVIDDEVIKFLEIEDELSEPTLDWVEDGLAFDDNSYYHLCDHNRFVGSELLVRRAPPNGEWLDNQKCFTFD